MKIKKISIAQDFSRFPGGRFRDDGDFSGQRFREDFLVPALTSSDVVVVDLDGTLGFGSSFLEEAFGGLVRVAKMKKQEIIRKLKLEGRNKNVAHLITEYIESA
jgi:hypothetical protein